ncbi:hypothetical protein PLICRDRAFT_438653 [Plicaturopsis crispa FD-325 SS-3]|uniref:Uncharacterized protein n=1 Tax=Plicaturopsis crispa FD-325 SS-3 TaxID=944288 RepID=A0A0C9SWI3_PLICR|nr:hypothetical protein PLICRDRAFT_438653 [Plicaturopsis crispa FD-325 SS-3]
MRRPRRAWCDTGAPNLPQTTLQISSFSSIEHAVSIWGSMLVPCPLCNRNPCRRSVALYRMSCSRLSLGAVRLSGIRALISGLRRHYIRSSRKSYCIADRHRVGRWSAMCENTGLPSVEATMHSTGAVHAPSESLCRFFNFLEVPSDIPTSRRQTCRVHRLTL